MFSFYRNLRESAFATPLPLTKHVISTLPENEWNKIYETLFPSAGQRHTPPTSYTILDVPREQMHMTDYILPMRWILSEELYSSYRSPSKWYVLNAR